MMNEINSNQIVKIFHCIDLIAFFNPNWSQFKLIGRDQFEA